jgi:hypothetical protein
VGTTIGTIVDAVDRAARAAQGRITIPKRFSLGVREMFAAQPRLEQPRGPARAAHARAAALPRGFRPLLLRADMGLAARDNRRLVVARAGGHPDRSRSHGGCTGRAAAPGGRRRGTPAPARRRRGRGRAPSAPMNADRGHHSRGDSAAATLAAGLRGRGQQSRGTAASRCSALLRRAGRYPRIAADPEFRRSYHTAPLGEVAQRRSSTPCGPGSPRSRPKGPAHRTACGSSAGSGREPPARALGPAPDRSRPCWCSDRETRAHRDPDGAAPRVSARRDFVLYPLADIAARISKCPASDGVASLRSRVANRGIERL